MVRCFYKDMMVFIGEVVGVDVVVGMGDDVGVGGVGFGGVGVFGVGKKGSYVLFVLCGVGGVVGVGVGERMGGKYGERDDLVMFRVINVSLLLMWEIRSGVFVDIGNDRFLRWWKRMSCVICLSVLVGLFVFFWLKIVILVWLRVLFLLVLWIVVMLLRFVLRWMVLVLGI